MKKHKENLFSAKFRLLDSQEHSEEIVWSSSDSSEFEDACNKGNFKIITNKKTNLKRKRKSKTRSNVSNLDVTIIDVNKDSNGDISPILACKTKPKMIESGYDTTYIVSKLQDNSNRKPNLTSPVLCTGTQRANLNIKSPVIPQKFASPVNSPKVRKILFSETRNNKDQSKYRSVSPLLNQKFELDRRKTQQHNIKKELELSQDAPLLKDNGSEFKEHEQRRVETRSKNRVNIDLIKKVQAFFDNQFNSESSSQHSIADTPTPKNTSSDDIEIINITQMTSNESSIKTMKHTNSTDNSIIETEKSKKMRYKKDGLAHRLCSLLKKHSANISLWQHERFLAENSNFKIPKGEHLVFWIKNVNFKYGSYLLETMDASDEVFFILINSSYVNNCTFGVDSIFKLYEPYHIFCFVGNRFIVNVCKFECGAITIHV